MCPLHRLSSRNKIQRGQAVSQGQKLRKENQGCQDLIFGFLMRKDRRPGRKKGALASGISTGIPFLSIRQPGPRQVAFRLSPLPLPRPCKLLFPCFPFLFLSSRYPALASPSYPIQYCTTFCSRATPFSISPAMKSSSACSQTRIFFRLSSL